MSDALDTVYRYHDGTKHHVHRFARSLGYLDWASQPRPFRAFADTATIALYPSPGAVADGYAPPPVTFAELGSRLTTAAPLCAELVGDVLRHSLGLSAWKRADTARWPLRVNPSSGNLHPTEAYVVCGPLPSVSDTPGVYHYAPDRHLLEQRCAFNDEAWRDALGERQDVLFVVLTSIHWREAWKYGERAFRYCQHDLGHAVAAVSFAAALVGWRATMLPAFSHSAIAALAGIDRDQDFVDAEREEPGCVIALSVHDSLPVSEEMVRALVLAVTGGRWSGHASQLSEDHVTWSFIDEVATATEQPARTDILSLTPVPPRHPDAARGLAGDARALVLQ
ncbi:MAG: SagB/ThcOx family dehydrogenase, partial [Vicinamibacterales bacterium]